MSLYKMPVSELKGFGEKRAEQFEKIRAPMRTGRPLKK